MAEDKDKKGDDILKEKIIIFAIGLLVGSIFSTTGFIIYNKMTRNNYPIHERMGKQEMNGRFNNGQRPEMPKNRNEQIPEDNKQNK